MKKRRVLVTGAGGMVGNYMPEVFSDLDLILTDIVPGFVPLDVRVPSETMQIIASERPDWVIHLAAATDVDRCEQDPEWAYHSNAVGTQNVALACQKADVPLVYVSTAGVFWGDKADPYIEFDIPRPANIYGHSKLAGEQIVSSLLNRFYIVRAGWMMGGGAKDKKFVGKMVGLISSGKQVLRVVNDKWGSPTYGKDLVRGIRRLLDTGYYGLYHMSNGGRCSRYEVALEVCRALQRTDIHVEPISSDDFPLPAPRATSEVMRNLKLQLLNLDSMRPWQDALCEYIQDTFDSTRL